jgi:DNA-directed RNA polymerase subunit beta'
MALRTADSGYLTRRLVDIAQDIIIRLYDCCSEGVSDIPGMYVSALKDGNELVEALSDRIQGRYSIDNIYHPETNEIIVKKDTMITPDQADLIETLGIESVHIRTVLTCKSKIGVCVKCYGANMASGNISGIGESVGIIAAQSIGEPGTQLTMRNFHEGGIASREDITQGLPRVEELFEARKPKGLAIISEITGRILVTDIKKSRKIVVTGLDKFTGNEIVKEYMAPFGARLKVRSGDYVEVGDELTEGSVYPQDILRIKGIRGVQDYLLREVQKVYRLQGVDINDKHIEVIVRQMLRRVRIEDSGTTNLFPGNFIDWLEFEELERAGSDIKGTRLLMGITKASLATDSFLSAASFQETTKVLTEASIHGKIDPLIGLKENVILGKLIPAGTGMAVYQKLDLETLEDNNDVALENSAQDYQYMSASAKAVDSE